MNTFLPQSESNQRKYSRSFQGHKNSQKNKSYMLTQKGFYQAHRNDSKQIWKLFDDFQSETEAQTQGQFQINQTHNQFINKSFKKSPQEYQNQNNQKQSEYERQKQIKKIKCQLRKQENQQTQTISKKNKKVVNKQQIQIKEKNPLKEQESFLKKMNQQIAKYLQQQKYCSRQLSNSAFAKLYNRPCIQTYGYGNSSKYAETTKNLLKTHNITPHSNQNKPSTYQTYNNAIKHAKRTKFSQQIKQQKIRKQFLKWFDDSIVQEAQQQQTQLNKQKKAKSLVNIKIKQSQQLNHSQQNITEHKSKQKGLKELLKSNEPEFIYKYKESDGSVKLAKDRHGLTCYVDTSLSGNEKALFHFDRKLNPILPEQVKPQDFNLDKIRKQNYKKSIEQNHPLHYMIPCVTTSYDRNKYQFRKKKSESSNH